MKLKFLGFALSSLLLIAIANPAVAFQKEENLIKISNALQQEREHPRLIKLINWSYVKCILECVLRENLSFVISAFYLLGICWLMVSLFHLLHLRFIFSLGDFFYAIPFFVMGTLLLSIQVRHCNEKCCGEQCSLQPSDVFQREKFLTDTFFIKQESVVRLINWSFIACVLRCILEDPYSFYAAVESLLYLSFGIAFLLWSIAYLLRSEGLSFFICLLSSIFFFAIGVYFLSISIHHCSEKCMEGQCPVTGVRS